MTTTENGEESEARERRAALKAELAAQNEVIVERLEALADATREIDEVRDKIDALLEKMRRETDERLKRMREMYDD